MFRTRYGLSPWLDRFPASRRPSYPRHRGHLEVEVVIAGGGLTGCATAYAFAAAGIPVALVEAGRLGEGTTAATNGVLMQEAGRDFRALERTYGLKEARQVWQANRRAALDFAATIRRLGIRCKPESSDSIAFATAREAEKALRREYQARRDAGLEVSWLSAPSLARETAIPAAGGLRVRGNAQIDPYRACLGFAAAAEARGARIFERSAVRKVRAGRKTVEVRTEGGTFKARALVFATGLPTEHATQLRRHVRPRETYYALTEPMPAAVRREVGRRSAMMRDCDAPPHTLRWTSDDRVLFGGADQPATPPRTRERVLVQRTGQLMYELTRLYPAISGLQPAYGWSATYGQTADGLMFIGPHRNYPRQLFALGYAANGVTGAFLASRILLREHHGEPEQADELFGFARILG